MATTRYRVRVGLAQLSPTDYQLPIRYQPAAAGRAEGGTRPSQWPSGSPEPLMGAMTRSGS